MLKLTAHISSLYTIYRKGPARAAAPRAVIAQPEALLAKIQDAETLEHLALTDHPVGTSTHQTMGTH